MKAILIIVNIIACVWFAILAFWAFQAGNTTEFIIQGVCSVCWMACAILNASR